MHGFGFDFYKSLRDLFGFPKSLGDLAFDLVSRELVSYIMQTKGMHDVLKLLEATSPWALFHNDLREGAVRYVVGGSFLYYAPFLLQRLAAPNQDDLKVYHKESDRRNKARIMIERRIGRYVIR